MVYGYARVSTREQNPDREIIAINRFCDSRGIAKVKVYVDKVTGKSIKRPEYQKIRRKIKAGDSLIIPEMDRLGRKKDILAELAFFKKKKVRVLILEIPTTLIDYESLDNWMAEFMMDMINNLLLEVFAACAEFEMEKREKRQREGYEALKARGEWDKLGRPVKMTQEEFLNKWNQKGKNVTDKEFAESLNISKGTLQSYKKKYLKGKK